MPDETPQTEPSPTQPENQNSDINSIPESPQEPTEQASIPTEPSNSVETSLDKPETPSSPEEAVPVNNDIPANEPLETSPASNIPNEPDNSNPPATAPPEASRAGITIEKHGTDTTITEVMQPTAQMAGNEPFDKTQDKPVDLAEEIKIKQRQENLKLANQTRQDKKRKKIDAILDLFAEQTNLTNDEVEKLLHVSDATATRYLETLEKEGKIRQVGKTGKSVSYTKI